MPPSTTSKQPTKKMAVQRRTRLTKEMQLGICAQARLNPGMTREALGAWAVEAYGLPRAPSAPSITAMLRREAQLRALPREELQRKSKGDPTRRRLRDAILEELRALAHNGSPPITGPMIKRIAQEKMDALGIPEAARPRLTAKGRLSNGWLHNFQVDVRRLQQAEARAAVAGHHGGLPEPVVSLLQVYDPESTYTLRRVALRYEPWVRMRQQAMPPTTCSTMPGHARLTGLLCANASGSDRLPPWFIGTDPRPPSMVEGDAWEDETKGHRQNGPRWVHRHSGAHYRATPRAWLCAEVFCEYLKHLDAEMRSQGRRILLLVDKIAARVWDSSRLTNVYVNTEPPSVVGQDRPHVETLAEHWKTDVRNRHLETLHVQGPLQVDVAQAMDWGIGAWEALSHEPEVSSEEDV